jgi:hypothetical protein
MAKKDDCGQCIECKEYCELGNPCCNSWVFFEGSYYSAEDFLEEDEDARGLDAPSRSNAIYTELKREGY